MLLSVLHHVPNQKKMLNEAKRVSKKLLIHEDVIANPKKKMIYLVFDNIINLDYLFNANKYHSEKEWEEIFKENGFKVVKKIKKKAYFSAINQVLFYVEEK